MYDHLILQDANFIYLVKVNGLWIPNQKQWNDDLICHTFMNPLLMLSLTLLSSRMRAMIFCAGISLIMASATIKVLTSFDCRMLRLIVAINQDMFPHRLRIFLIGYGSRNSWHPESKHFLGNSLERLFPLT